MFSEMESFYHAWWKGKAMYIEQDNLRIKVIFIYINVYTEEEPSTSEVDGGMTAELLSYITLKLSTLTSLIGSLKEN